MDSNIGTSLEVLRMRIQMFTLFSLKSSVKGE